MEKLIDLAANSQWNKGYNEIMDKHQDWYNSHIQFIYHPDTKLNWKREFFRIINNERNHICNNHDIPWFVIYGIYKNLVKCSRNWLVEREYYRTRHMFYTLLNKASVTFDIIKANPDIPWNWYSVSINPNITWDIVEANPDIQWDYGGLSTNYSIPWLIIRENLDMAWDIRKLAKRTDIPWDDIIATIDMPGSIWNWRVISAYPNLTVDIILANINKPWNWEALSNNVAITFSLVLKTLDKPWVYNKLICHINIDPLMFSEFINICCVKLPRILYSPYVGWSLLASRTDVTLDVILKYPNYPWDWNIILKNNPNLTLEFVYANMDNFKYGNLKLDTTVIRDYVFNNPLTTQTKLAVSHAKSSLNKRTNYLWRYQSLGQLQITGEYMYYVSFKC